MGKMYLLKHKDEVCAIIELDEVSGNLVTSTLIAPSAAPFAGIFTMNNAKRWWAMRSIPGSRKQIKEILQSAGCMTSENFLAKNLALSLTDCYWVCPEDIDLHWDEVKLYQHRRFTKDYLPYHHASSYDPNASLGGQMDKVWDVSTQPPVLIKTASAWHGQQSLNELFATELHKRLNAGIPFVEYSIEISPFGEGIRSTCTAFTSEQTEFVSAYEVVSSQKVSSQLSPYDAYIFCCVQLGLDEKQIRDFMDYQTMTDFVISNTDEHLLNFGLLRDTESLEMTGPAPIFDSGNSMFYSDQRNKPYTRSELLDRNITGFYTKEEKMLARVQNKALVKEDLLFSPEEVRDFYLNGGLPEERAAFIADSYAAKLSLLHDFFKGKTISFYTEKQKIKALPSS